MYRLHLAGRGALLAALAGTLIGCTGDTHVVMPTPTNDLFRSYVSLGNSITMGFQSLGVNDSTQRASYAYQLARQMHTRFAYASLAAPGCPPPVVNLLTGARTGPIPPGGCALRDKNSVTATLNNVAVYNAFSVDPTSPTTANSNAFTTLVLGGKTQVQKALEADPTFATIWIGNNDILSASGSGILTPVPNVSPGLTPLATFQTNYDAMVSQLVAGAPNLKGGVLIGVVNALGAAVFFPAGALASPAFRGGFDQVAGFNPASSDPAKRTPLTIDPNCAALPSTLVYFGIAKEITNFRNDSTKAPSARAGHPPIISCGPSTLGFPAPVGDVFILTPSEQTTVFAAVTAYNAYIQQKAASIGFAYLDPNKGLDSLRAAGQIGPVPNLAAPTAVFGKWVSLDGVHPATPTHALLTNYLIDVINAKYATSLVKVAVP